MMKINRNFCVLILVQIVFTTFCFAQQAQWAHFLGGPSQGQGEDVQVDALGNVYSIGQYSFNFNSGAVDFDPGPGAFSFTQPTNTGACYISKLDANGNFVWARSFTSNGVSGARIEKLQLLPDGNFLISGVFRGNVDFNLSAGIFNLMSHTTTTNSDTAVSDFFIAKYNSAGNFIWAKSFSCEPLTIVSNYPNSNSTADLCLDAQNNIILAASFRGRVDLNPGPGEEWKECYGLSYNAIVIKLDSNGDYIWGKHFAGADNGPSSMAIDAQNNIYLNGIYSQGVDFDPGPAELWIYNYSFSDSYILKMNPNGEVGWINKIYGPYAGYGGCSDIAIDEEGNVLATGAIVRDSLYFTSATDSLYLVKSNTSTETGNNGFVTKIDSNGHFLWLKQMTSNTEYGVSGTHILTDSINNIYTLGVFSDSADFNYSDGGAIKIATGDYSCFLMKLDSEGNYIRTSVIDGDRFVNSQAFTLDQNANIYFTGFFNVVNFGMNFPWGQIVGTGMIDFDPGPDTLPLIGWGNGPETVFVAKWNQCSTGADTLTETACNTFTWNDDVYAESGIYTKSLTTALGCDSIAAINLTILNSSTASQNIQICSGETFSIGNQTFNQSGIYQSILIAQNGCDSLVTTNLIVDTLAAEIELTENVFTALNLPTNAQSQWLNCDTNFEEIFGENDASFIATANGIYALETSLGNCRDTSECVALTSVGINDQNQNEFRVYPNPADVKISIVNKVLAIPITITDSQGRLIVKTTSNSTTQEIDVSSFSNGIYFLQVNNSTKIISVQHAGL